MRGAGTDGLEVAMKPGNAGGAKGPDIPAPGHGQPAMGGALARGKAYVIPKQLVWEAYQRVKANRGAAGVDGQSLAAFEEDLKGNLYKVWNRMSSALVERAVAHHTDVPWVRLYIARWLRALVQMPDGTLEPRTTGTPQGGVISPLLANLFLHYAFDMWMRRTFPGCPFERYADDVAIHCRSKAEAQAVVEAIRGRFAQCHLELHPTKTRIVYCQDDDRPEKHEHVRFDFLGYTFQPRRAKNRRGKFFVSFLPAISTKAAKAVRKKIREWRMASTRNNQRLEDLARVVNPVVRGWMNYYGRFYRSRCVQVLRHLNEAIAAWVRRKFTRFRNRERASMYWLGRLARREPTLFAHWQLGVRPEAGV